MAAARPAVPPLVPVGATFAFGRSPFRAKGVLYLGTQGFFEQNVQGGLGALVSEIREDELKAFISQKFLPSGWYDVLPVPALIAYEARALRMTLPEYLLHRTRYQAKRDLGGVYGWVLRLATPGLVASRLPKIMSQMFDFTEPVITQDGDHGYEIRFPGVPAVLEQWLHSALSVYADTAMKLAGARTVDAPPAAVEPGGEREGVRLVTLVFRLGWT